MKVTYYGSFWEEQAAGGEVGQEGKRSDEGRCQGAAEGHWCHPWASSRQPESHQASSRAGTRVVTQRPCAWHDEFSAMVEPEAYVFILQAIRGIRPSGEGVPSVCQAPSTSMRGQGHPWGGAVHSRGAPLLGTQGPQGPGQSPGGICYTIQISTASARKRDTDAHRFVGELIQVSPQPALKTDCGDWY